MSAVTHPLLIELALRSKSIVVCFSGGTFESQEWAVRSLMKIVGIDGSKFSDLVVVDPVSSAFSRISFSRELIKTGISDERLRAELKTLLEPGYEILPY